MEIHELKPISSQINTKICLKHKIRLVENVFNVLQIVRVEGVTIFDGNR